MAISSWFRPFPARIRRDLRMFQDCVSKYANGPTACPMLSSINGNDAPATLQSALIRYRLSP